MDSTNVDKTPKKGVSMSFSLIDDLSEKAVEVCTEPVRAGSDFIWWGRNNKYPEYLYSRYMECSTLQSIVNGTSEYVAGNGITVNTAVAFTQNSAGDGMYDIAQKAIIDRVIFGGFAIQVIRSNDRQSIADIVPVDVRRCRLNEDETEVFVSRKTSTGRVEWDRYPAFSPNADDPVSIYFYTGKFTRTHYPVPMYIAALLAIETQIEIQHFHYNSIVNSFATNVLINVNSGIPSDEEKAVIEKGIKDKYCGTGRNKGIPLIMYNEPESAPVTVEKLQDDNYAKKYDALAKSTRENIFAAFRATPALFGIMTETTGFNEQEFTEAFKLYNRTAVKPMQSEMTNVFDYILGVKNSVQFIPFSVE